MLGLFNRGIKMKDGSRVKDRRLGRLKEFDERSRLFAIRPEVTGLNPVSKNWQCELYLDQGQTSSCVGNAATHELAASPQIYKDLTEGFAMSLYYLAQQLDQWPGGEYPGATPQYGGTSTLAGMKSLQRHGYIKSYRWAFGWQDAVLAIGHHGPVVIGINWYDGMFHPNANGYIHPTGNIAGGHDILVRAVRIVWLNENNPKTIDNVDTANSFVVLHNSWGKDWGINGEARLSLVDLDRLLSEDGDCAIPLGRVAQKNVKGAIVKSGKRSK